MKKSFAFIRYLVLAIVFIITASYITLKLQETNAATTTTKDEVLEQVIISGLNSGHFKPQEVNDDFSKKIFKLYLERIDFNKRFFIKEDIDKLKKYEDKIDDDIRNRTFTFYNLSRELIEKRVKENENLYKEILSAPFDFTVDETIELDPDKTAYPQDKAAQKELWRKYLKYQALVRVNEMMEAQERAKEKGDTVVEAKTMEQMEAEARKQVMKSYDELFKRLAQLDHEDRFAMFLNTIANTYDPHTEYFPPKEKKNFDIAMSGRLEGIGATLMEKDDYIKVSAIVPGSASWKQGQLKPGDVILKVAQGAGEPVDVVGMRLDNAVELIRGKKGTEVRLTVKKADGSIVVIPIIRDVVIIEETYAQSAIVKEKSPIGYIKLPGFYADFGKTGGRNSSDDVKKEIIKLKGEGVKGIIIDLRDNGGGSLQDVVEMMGYFIDRGPVVQVKTQTGAPNVFYDRDDGIIWDGPLVVMVNANSASASEILAAAVQDYKRGVVIGTSPTFGKGTVQRFVELDDYIDPAYSNLKPLGSLKLTTEKFYRINGNSTQLKGVTPDVLLPDPYSYVDRGEKEMDYPLPFDETTPAKYTPWQKAAMDIEKVKKSSKARVASNPWFKQVSEAARIMEERSKKTTYTLNLAKFMAEQKKLKEDAKKLENPEKETGIQVTALKVDLEAAAGDTSKAARTEDWFKKLKRDVYLQEAMNVIADVQPAVK
jgi:carboxyl-terminal processing protease